MSVIFSLYSGNPTADRRVDFALMLFAERDYAGATASLLAALELAPGWALGWFHLGEFHEAAGDMAGAIAAWRTALTLDPADHSGASLKLALAESGGGRPVPPSAFVEMLFDQYALKFDRTLVDVLGYRVPDLLAVAIDRQGRGRFGLALDLGCGTGLMGERLRPVADMLEGYDISAEMLRKARGKGVYDRLVKADLQTIDLPPASADLVTAADVFMYIGALDGIVSRVASALLNGGLFAFSVEHHAGSEDFVLRPSRRYAHAEPYVRDVLARNGFAVLSLERHGIRHDRGEPVEGLVVVAERQRTIDGT